MYLGLDLSLMALAIRRAYGGFSPASLFANGEQGVFYDISDTATLFQDSAGVTPVTAVEQTVGLILDKSKGGVGTNGAKRVNLLSYTEQFDNAAWTKTQTTVTADAELAPNGTTTADKAIPNTSNVFHDIRAASPLASLPLGQCVLTVYLKAAGYDFAEIGVASNVSFGKFSTAVIDLSAGSDAGTGANLTWTTNSVQVTSAGSGWYKCELVFTTDVATTTAMMFFSARPTSTRGTAFAGDGTSGVFVWGADLRLASEVATAPTYQRITDTWYNTLPGNHAFQTDSAKRPLWSSRYNLAIRSEDLSNAAWSTGAVSSGTRVNGSVSVSSNEGFAYVQQIGSFSSAANQTISFDVTCDQTINNVPIRAAGVSFSSVSQLVNLTAGETVRVTLRNFGPETTSFSIGIDARNAVVPGGSDATGYTVTFNRVDLRVANESNALPPYQRVVTATDYDAGPQWPKYLRFDGSNDALITNSIDFAATDEVSVFAGVRKLSDAARATVVELTATAASNNGAFHLTAPDAASATYAFESKGTTLTAAVGTVNSAAPRTDILSGIGNISGDSASLRVNAQQAALNTGDQGTGNYANAVMYIGGRAGTSQYLNARLFSLVVLGRGVTPTELTQTEGYVEAKTFGKDMNYVYSVPILDPDGNQLLVTAGGDPLFMNVNYE
jgi:hypothetical protein